jgi:DNA-binding response OmpR family regulator
MACERILLIESEKTQAIRIAGEVEKAGYGVVLADNTLDSLQVLSEVHPQLVILVNDLPLAETDIFLALLRQASRVPIIVIGAHEDAAVMLENGADAYLDTPPSLIELVARVRSILRRQGKSLPGEKHRYRRLETAC